MFLSTLHIEHFRGFDSLHLTFPQSHTSFCFVGPNTIGKTNILEAIYVLTLLKSFRTNTNEELLKWECEHLQIKGTFVQDQQTLDLQFNALFSPRAQKKMRINNVVTPLQDYVGQVNVVFFSPDDINLLLLSPNNRRKYLDILLSQTDRSYLTTLVHFQKALKQRNALIKQIARGGNQHTQELQVWNEEIARWAFPIMHKRQTIIEHLSSKVDLIYRDISKNPLPFYIHYHPSGKTIPTDISGFVQQLEERFPRDIAEECTTLGPHRDDFFFYVEKKPIDTFASRGDTRSMILALKLAEIHYIETIQHQKPILLLDDVFSELDAARQTQLLSTFPSGIQTIMTTTNKEGNALKNLIKDDVYFFDMETMIYS